MFLSELFSDKKLSKIITLEDKLSYKVLTRNYNEIFPIDNSEYERFINKKINYCNLHAYGGGMFTKWYYFRGQNDKLYIVYTHKNYNAKTKCEFTKFIFEEISEEKIVVL